MSRFRDLSRRDVLRLGGAVSLYVATPAWAAGRGLPRYDYRGAIGPESMFAHGVASGDPLPDGIVLWTRVSPAAPGKVEVFWEMALDDAFQDRVAAGTVVTTERDDYTVKIDVRGLDQGRDYFYRFIAQDRASRTGHTRLAPRPGDDVERVRIGMASCSSYAHGWFHGYEKLAEQPDLDLVLHLGDYIYEYATNEYGSVRPYEPSHEILALDDYRERHAQYKRDPQLQALHAAVPFVTIWDDHEVADDSWRRGAVNHQEDEGSFRRRKLAAIRAYFEWMPIREKGRRKVTRGLHYGDLVDLVMIDTRHTRRDQQTGPLVGPPPIEDSPRQLLGRKQEAFVRQALTTSRAQWKLVGNQVVMTPLRIPLGGDLRILDSWDGYPGARARFLETLREGNVGNVVICTGDIHASGAGEVSEDPFTNPDPVAAEIVTPGITSPFPLPALIDPVRQANPHLRFAEAARRGYVVLDIDASRILAQWWLLDQVENQTGASQTLAAAFEVRDGDSHLHDVTVSSPSGAFV